MWVVDVAILHENFAVLNDAIDLLIHRDLLFIIPDAVEFELEHPGVRFAFLYLRFDDRRLRLRVR